jgi:hypothetical protein
MRLWGKTLVKMAGASAKAECGNKNSCAGLEASVEGNLYAVQEMGPDAGGWEDDAGEEDDNIFAEVLKRMAEAEDGDEITVTDCDSPGITLGDAENGFNMLNCYAMLWNVRHRWSEGARFAFNCYHHFLILVIRNNDGHTASFLDGQEGVSQGDPLSMLLYGVAFVLLVERVNEAYPGALIPWFAYAVLPVKFLQQFSNIGFRCSQTRLLPKW